MAGGALFTPIWAGSERADGRQARDGSRAGPVRIVHSFSGVSQCRPPAREDRSGSPTSRDLAVLLDPNGRIDLTNRNATYFTRSRVPIESGALYNLPDDRQRLRAVARLKKQQTRWFRMLKDRSMVSCRRTHLQHLRYLAANYVRWHRQEDLPREPDRLQRLDRRPELHADRSDPAMLTARSHRRSGGPACGVKSSWGRWGRRNAGASARSSTLVQARAVGPRRPGRTSRRSVRLSASARKQDAGIVTFDLLPRRGRRRSRCAGRLGAPRRTSLRDGSVLGSPSSRSRSAPSMALAPDIATLGSASSVGEMQPFAGRERETVATPWRRNRCPLIPPGAA